MSIVNANPKGYATAVSGIERVTLSNTTNYEDVKGFLVGGSGGTLNLTFADGSSEDGIPCLAGVWYMARIRQFRTGGTATDVWALK